MEDEHGRSTPLDPQKSRILFMAVIAPHGWSQSAKHFIARQQEVELITAEEAPSLEHFMGLVFNPEALSVQGGNFLLLHFSSLKCVCSCNYSNVESAAFILLLPHLLLILLTIHPSLPCVSVYSSLLLLVHSASAAAEKIYKERYTASGDVDLRGSHCRAFKNGT